MLKALTTLTLIILPGTALAADWGGFYAQIYGGVRTQGDTTFSDPEEVIDALSPDDAPLFSESFTLNSGPAFGGSVGLRTPIDGLSVGVDVMHTHTNFTDFTDQDVDTLSIMGTVEGAYHLSDRFDLYATGGLGAMNIAVTDHENPNNVTNGWAPAYEAAAGIRLKATDNLSLFTEIKHQDVFTAAAQPLPGSDSTGFESVGTTSVLAGLLLSF
jgi:opacity protein-like surface antigen